MKKIKNKIDKFLFSLKNKQSIIDDFHKLYYSSDTWSKNTQWLGVTNLKLPQDLWIYQEMIYNLQPDIIIETGTYFGGSAYYMATICDIIKKGKIITVDINSQDFWPKHDRINYLIGSSIDPNIVNKIGSQINKDDKVLVILDSDHSKKHVLEELKIYNQFVTKGSYLIVEDTNVNGHPVFLKHGPGPKEALEEFLKTNDAFVIDKEREKFLLTFNPDGFLRKVK